MRQLRGVPASPGIAVAAVRHQVRAAIALGAAVTDRAAEADRARRVLEEAAVELETIAAGLRDQGLAAEADIVATGALMARYPTLVGGVDTAIASDGLPAAEGII